MKPIKIVFLDIDGVLNNTFERTHYITRSPRDGHFISPTCVDRLNEITSFTGAKIVVTSTWRLGSTDEEMARVLEVSGVTGEYIGMTGRESESGEYIMRGNEIFAWILRNEELCGSAYDYRDYVILDDDSDMLLWQRNNYINCDPHSGLTHRSVARAISILNNTPCEDAGQEFIS